MLKILTLAVAAGAVSALLVVDAGALPLAPLGPAAAESHTTLVRDGCGRGMRFSNRRQACVEDFDRGPPVVIQRGCRPGMRFSNSRGGCVPIDEGRRGNDVGRALNLLLGQPSRPSRGCGPGMRFSNSRQRCVPD